MSLVVGLGLEILKGRLGLKILAQGLSSWKSNTLENLIS